MVTYGFHQFSDFDYYIDIVAAISGLYVYYVRLCEFFGRFGKTREAIRELFQRWHRILGLVVYNVDEESNANDACKDAKSR